jgi:hypothetical protein
MILPEITAAITSISAGYKIVKGFTELKTEYEIKAATSELFDSIIGVQNNLLSIQSSYQSLLDSKSELEKEIVNLKQWETTKLNHALKQVASGVFVYVLKEPEDSPDNKYWLCANCFDTKNHKSIFQRKHPGNEDYCCHNCNAKISLPEKSRPSPTDQGGSWMSR